MSASDMPSHLGRYEILNILGRGAMGVVYEGVDPNIGRRVAIKTARRDVLEASGRADEMIERFLREARAAGTLNHRNIITIYDADEQDGTAYIAMELIDGTDLQKIIAEKGRFTPEETVQIGATVCEALAHAHDNGVVHRDVKPSNIMVLNDKSIRVADFGIARVKDSSLTQEGAMIGTPHYMSPEQFMGQRVDGRSDLFSVGIILYELLTGEKPFHGEAISTVMHAVIKTDPIDPHELNFSVSNVLSEVIMKSLAKSPGQRYADGRAMAAALRESLQENPDPLITRVGDPSQVGEKTMVVDSGSRVKETVVMDSESAASVTGGSGGMAETVSLEDAGKVEAKAEAPSPVPAPVPPPVPEPVPVKPWAKVGAAVAAVVVVAVIAVAAMMPKGELYEIPVVVGFVDEPLGDPVFKPGAEIQFFDPNDKLHPIHSERIDEFSHTVRLVTKLTDVYVVVTMDGYGEFETGYDLQGPAEDALIDAELKSEAVLEEMRKINAQ